MLSRRVSLRSSGECDGPGPLRLPRYARQRPLPSESLMTSVASLPRSRCGCGVDLWVGHTTRLLRVIHYTLRDATLLLCDIFVGCVARSGPDLGARNRIKPLKTGATDKWK